MKNLHLILIFLCLSLLVHCSNQEISKNAFFVSKSGNDSWTGKLAEPNRNKSDGPFATIERARDTIRSMKNKSNLSNGGITVYVREGDYPISATFMLKNDDSGTKQAPITWRAYPGESVRFMAGKVIGDFKPVRDESILNRIDESCWGKILQCDLSEQGIVNFGQLKRKGFGTRPRQPLALELFFDHKPMTLARYPNEGWLTIASVPQSGNKLEHKGNEREIFDGIPAGRHFGKIRYNEDRPGRWQVSGDIWMHGYWTWDWADHYEKIDHIDTTAKEICIAPPYHNYGYRKGQRYYFINILEELDSPGEYYLDRNSGMLYFYPPADLAGEEIAVSMLEDLVISLEGASHITIQDITFEYGRGGAIQIKGGSHIKIAGCAFRNFGNEPIIIEGGTENGVIGCDIYDVAAGGIIINAGDRKMLIPGNCYAENNDIHHFSRIFRTYSPAVNLNGVGNRVSHNAIHHGPHMGVLFYGNENILEYNEVYDLAKETGDVGAFYIGRDWTCRGNIIRHNYFHHLHGPGLHGVNAVYLDDLASGTTIYGNVFYKTDRGAFIGGGRDNTVENNTFIDCYPAVHVDARGLGWASFFISGKIPTMYNRMDDMNYSQPPYSEKYPELLALYADDPGMPKGNKILRNVSYRGKWMDIYGGIDFKTLIVKDNLVASSEPCQWSPLDKHVSIEKDFVHFKFGSKDVADPIKTTDNKIMDIDPGFIDVDDQNFQLKKDSPAFELGFERIPTEKIGLYKDNYRK